MIIMGNEGRVLREGVDVEIKKMKMGEVNLIGICWGWEYLGGDVIKEGELRKGWIDGEWYNHHDMVKRMGSEWKGKKRRGMWIEGQTRKWRGYQYHPEANEKSMKKMLKIIRKWRNKKRKSCDVVIKKLKSAEEVEKTRKRAYKEWLRERKNTRKNVRGGV